MGVRHTIKTEIITIINTKSQESYRLLDHYLTLPHDKCVNWLKNPVIYAPNCVMVRGEHLHSAKAEMSGRDRGTALDAPIQATNVGPMTISEFHYSTCVGVLWPLCLFLNSSFNSCWNYFVSGRPFMGSDNQMKASWLFCVHANATLKGNRC